MANGILSGIGQGLRTIGGALSPQAFAQEGAQRENIRGIEANKASQARAILINAIMQGAVNPDTPEAQKALSEIGVSGLGPNAQVQEVQRQNAERQRLIESRQRNEAEVFEADRLPKSDGSAEFDAVYNPYENPDNIAEMIRRSRVDKDYEAEKKWEARLKENRERYEPKYVNGSIVTPRLAQDTGSESYDIEGYDVERLPGEDKLNAKEKQIKRMTETVHPKLGRALTRNEAQYLVDFTAWKTDPQTGYTELYDLVTNGPVDQRSIATIGRSEFVPTEAMDVPGATGGSGQYSALWEGARDFLGFGMSEGGRAIDNSRKWLERVRNETIKVGRMNTPGKPLAFDSELEDIAAFDVTKIVQGDTSSRNQIVATRNHLQKELDRIKRDVLSPSARKKFKANEVQRYEIVASKFSELIGQYDWAAQQMQRVIDAPTVEDLDEMWERTHGGG